MKIVRVRNGDGLNSDSLVVRPFHIWGILYAAGCAFGVFAIIDLKITPYLRGEAKELELISIFAILYAVVSSIVLPFVRMIFTPKGQHIGFGITHKNKVVWGYFSRLESWDMTYVDLFWGWPFYMVHVSSAFLSIPFIVKGFTYNYNGVCEYLYKYLKKGPLVTDKVLAHLKKVTEKSQSKQKTRLNRKHV